MLLLGIALGTSFGVQPPALAQPVQAMTSVESSSGEAGTLPGRYLVRVQIDTSVRRSGLGDDLAMLRKAHRSRAAVGSNATSAPLLSPGDFRRQVVRSEQFRAARRQTQGDLRRTLDALSRHLGRSLRPIRTYDTVFGGFALHLNAEEAEHLAAHPLVIDVEAERAWPLQSDVGPDLVAAPDVWSGTATGTPHRGAGILVGVIDSGIEPLHLSFADVPGVLNPLGSGTYLGACLELIEGIPNPDYDPTFPCSDKLVGAYDLTAAYEHLGEGPDDGAFSSHGSHVASIAIGNEIDAGYGTNPTIPQVRGIAPLASVVAYDACVTASNFTESCDGSAIIAAIGQAVLDGVDVLNISILGSTSPWTNSEAMALLDAYEAGVLTVASAGNDGPGAGTITRLEPWVVNVGNSTHDRVDYLAVLSSSGGDEGTRPALFAARGMGAAVPTAEIVKAEDLDAGNSFCGGPFAEGAVTGKIVYCEQGGPLTLNGLDTLASQGAVAVLSYSTYPAFPIFPTDLPYFLVPASLQTAFETWLDTPAATSPSASLTSAALAKDPSYADIMRFDSSRGPVSGFDLLKPDLVAPGANILAAADSEYVVEVPDLGGKIAGLRYNSGTSMATPAVAGAAALLREMHPTLSPAEIQSVLQTTADPTGMTNCSTASGLWVPPCSIPNEPAGLFDFGSGRLDVTAAAKAGFAFDVTRDEFFAANPACDPEGLGPFPCDPAGPAQLNLPSMAMEDCGAGCAFARRASSIATAPVDWSSSFMGPRDAAAPTDLAAHVVPADWTLAPGAEQPFIVGVYATDMSVVDVWQELVLKLTPDDAGVSTARLPIVVKPSAYDAETDLEVVARTIQHPKMPGDLVRFQIIVRNLGSVPAVGVEVSADVLDGLDATTWSCTPPNRNWCGSGTGALLDLAAILPGEELVYDFEGTAQDPYPEPIQLDASINSPTGLSDPASSNDSASSFASTVLFADGFESGNTSAWI